MVKIEKDSVTIKFLGFTFQINVMESSPSFYKTYVLFNFLNKSILEVKLNTMVDSDNRYIRHVYILNKKYK